MDSDRWLIRTLTIVALTLILAACDHPASRGPDDESTFRLVQNPAPATEGGSGLITLGIAEVAYQSWTCQEGLVLFRDALVGNQGEEKTMYDYWLSPIACESAGRLLHPRQISQTR